MSWYLIVKIEDDEERANALSSLGPLLPDSLLPRALEIIFLFSSGHRQATALAALAHYLNDGILTEALAKLAKIQPIVVRLSGVYLKDNGGMREIKGYGYWPKMQTKNTIIKETSIISEDQLQKDYKKISSILADENRTRTRMDLFAVISEQASLIYSLGGEEAIKEVYKLSKI